MTELAILAKRMNCKTRTNMSGITYFKATSEKNEKYLKRRMIAIHITTSNGGKIYEHGKNMTLQKQPHKRKHIKF